MQSGFLNKYLFLTILSYAFPLNKIRHLLTSLNKNTYILFKNESKLVENFAIDV
jgi:hypothetical protein